MSRLETLPKATLALLVVISAGCLEATNAGQSGSEFTPSPDEGFDTATGQSANADLCPCEYLKGVPPLLGTVVSWYSGLLEIEVEEVLRDPAPPDAPEIGTRVIGMFDGALPCYRGLYLPTVGDRVIAFLVPDSSAKPWCCRTAACGPDCEAEADPNSIDTCLAECQGPAGEACAAEFEDVDVTGYLRATPLDADSLELARAGDVSFSVDRDDLELIFEGGDACNVAVSEVRDVLGEVSDPPGTRTPPQWRASCPGLSEPDP